ncbi:MAG TPA: AsmA-like C-terminal domain-containing protein [Burkholderiales bacterium]|nr:AsmA-like C-terminal domain-containing protein [Burkholderiales bacterium]
MAVLVVAAALFLPGYLDTPAVRAEIQRILSQAVRGEVAWEEFRIRVLPTPHGVLRKARLEIPAVASVRAEEATADLRLLPLFRGRVEITSVTVTRPVIRINVVAAAATEEKPKDRHPEIDILGAYRAAMRPVVDAVRDFAPDTLVEIEDAELEVRVPDALPMRLSKLTLLAHAGAGGMEFEATAASQYWSALTLSARIDYADLSAKASLRGTNIQPQAWLERYLGKAPVGVSLAAVRLSAEARTDAKTALEFELDARTDAVGIARAGERLDIEGVAVKGSVRMGVQETIIGINEVRLGGSRLMSGELRLSAKDGAVSGYSDYDLDLAQGMEYTRRLVPAPVREVLASFQPVTGRAQGRVKLAVGPPGWSVGVNVRKSDVAVQIRDLPGPVRLAGGAVDFDGHRVTLDRVALSMPAGKVLLPRLRYVFKDGSAAGEAGFDLDVAQSLEFARRALPEENRDALADIETAAGRVEGSAKFAFGPGGWKLGVDVSKSDATLGVRQLPGPVKVAHASIEAGPTSAAVRGAAVSLLDASAVASVTFDDFKASPRARGSIAEGTIGEKFLAWVWQLAQLPDRFEPATPIRVAAPSISWSRGGAVEVQASAQFEAGAAVTVDLGWTPDALDIRRATFKDGRSDAELALRVTGGLLEGRHAGSLFGTSVAAVLKRVKPPAGVVGGDLRFTIDRLNPQRTSASGHLKGEALDLAALTGQPLKIERIDLATDDAGLHVREATVDWAEQRMTLRGNLRRTESGPVIDAQLDSPGINLDALAPPKPKTAAEPPPKPAAGGKDVTSRLWPLPVTGRITIRSDFIQRGRYRVAPVAATLSLEQRRAHLDLEQAELCGISLPLTLDATPQGYSATARVAAQKQQLEQTAHCLSGERVEITGTYDLKADISTQGTLAELPGNLKGTVRGDMRDGRVMKFALLGNILSMTNVASLMKADGPKLDDRGFPYRALIVAGHFKDGRFILDEGAFQSDAVGLAANGWISTTDFSTRLTVLVAPFSRLDELVRKVPVVGYIVGGVFTSVPVGVSGDIRDPLVVPLGPAAVTSEVLGIFERTLKLPAKLVTPLETK